MKDRSIRKISTAICLLVTSLSAAPPALATWYMNNQSEGYYKPQEYHNERFGDFPPADIDQKLFEHLNTENNVEESKSVTDNTSLSTTTSNQPVYSSNQQLSNPAQNYSEQNYQQPAAYGRNDRGRSFTSPGLERHIRKRNEHLSGLRNNRGSSFSAPRNNRGSSFSVPWNNRGSSFSVPWNNRGSSFSGPWNNRGSSFSGPWNNNGSSFSAPWSNNRGNNRGNNNGSNFSPFGNGSGWSW